MSIRGKYVYLKKGSASFIKIYIYILYFTAINHRFYKSNYQRKK
jgi:hypothetical protein